MSNRRPRREPPLTGFQRKLAAASVATLGMTETVAHGRTVLGTVLDGWIRGITLDGGGLSACGHFGRGDTSSPKFLSADDPRPMVRCWPCAEKMLAGLADDGICHLCGRESAIFNEFACMAKGGLVIQGNACPACIADIRRARPAVPD